MRKKIPIARIASTSCLVLLRVYLFVQREAKKVSGIILIQNRKAGAKRTNMSGTKSRMESAQMISSRYWMFYCSLSSC